MTDQDTFALAMELLNKGGSATNLAVVALVVAVFLARKFGVKRLPWLASDRAGVAMTLVLAVCGALATSLMAGAAVGPGLVFAAATAALKAAGGWSLVTKFLWPDTGKKLSPSLRPSVTVPSVSGGVAQVIDPDEPKPTKPENLLRDRR